MQYNGIAGYRSATQRQFLQAISMAINFPFPNTVNEGTSANLRFVFDTNNQNSYFYQTRDGTATANSDYVPTSGTIAPNTTSFFNVQVLNDGIYESDETVNVDLFQSVSGTTSVVVGQTTIAQSFVSLVLVTTVQGTIVDDDAPPSVQLSTASVSMAEGNVGSTTDFVYTISRTSLSQQSQTVDYAVSGSGMNPADANDFVGGLSSSTMTATMAPTMSLSPVVSGTVTFAAGETVQQITIQVRGDATVESDEQFTVYLTGSNFGTASGSATGVIQNDDTAVVPPPPPSDPGPSTTPSTGPDQLTGSAGADTIAGMAGNDTISGGDGNDLLYGNQDQDIVDGGSGNNTIYGGMGNDSVSAGAGNDLLFGNEGSDTINAGDGNNTVVGGQDSTDGADLITAGGGNDLILGNGGDDSVSAGAGNDSVVGGFGNDILFGNQGNDIILGNQGNDLIFGGMGDDTLVGGMGDDTLYGNEGNDVLYGNEGADRLVFGTNSGSDLVNGFSQAEGDRLDLQGQTYTAAQDANGNTVLTLSGGGMVTLAGIAANQVNASFFSS